MCCERSFLEQLRGRGLKLTPQREIVLAALHEMGEHPSVEQLFERVHARYASIDIATVYRTLELLDEFGLVHALDLGDGARHYELRFTQTPHNHMLCSRCGTLYPLEGLAMQALAGRLREMTGFDAASEGQVVRGLCAVCREQVAQDAPGLSC